MTACQASKRSEEEVKLSEEDVAKDEREYKKWKSLFLSRRKM